MSRKILFILFIFYSTGIISQSLDSLVVGDKTYTYYDPNYELIDAASTGDTLKLKAFLEAGADVNAMTWEGVTPLMFAAQNGHLRAVEILIDSGARVNLKPYNQIDALLGATIAGHVHIADTLILNGANVKTRNLDGVTPLMYAAAYDYFLLCDVLIFYGARVNTVDNYGNRPIHFAAFYGNTDIIQLLIQNGAALDEPDKQGFTPLMIASQNGHLETVQLLVENGVDINKEYAGGFNALTLAVYSRRYEVAAYLLSIGANSEQMISKRISLHDLANEMAGSQMVSLLEENGVTPYDKFYLKKLIINPEVNWNNKDLMVGGSLELLGSKYRLLFEGGYRTRPAVRSVLYEKDPDIFYQFWEKRSLIFLGAGKRFLIASPRPRALFGAFAAANLGYTYGNFRGSNRKPDDSFLFIPKAGIYYDNKLVAFKAYYEYMNLKNTKVPASRFTISLGIKLNLVKTKILTKNEPEL